MSKTIPPETNEISMSCKKPGAEIHPVLLVHFSLLAQWKIASQRQKEQFFKFGESQPQSPEKSEIIMSQVSVACLLTVS
jgi:hypothetical protein